MPDELKTQPKRRFDVLAQVEAIIPFQVWAADEEEARLKVVDQINNEDETWDQDLSIDPTLITFGQPTDEPEGWEVYDETSLDHDRQR